jgi:hypothetical protein
MAHRSIGQLGSGLIKSASPPSFLCLPEKCLVQLNAMLDFGEITGHDHPPAW